MREVEADLLSVGGSDAGITAAICAASKDLNVTLVSKGKVGRNHSFACTTAQVHGVTCDFEYRCCTPPTIGETRTTEVAHRSITALFGRRKTTGGEDFVWFLEQVPGTYIFVGIRNEVEGKCHPHQYACSDIDERALANGTAALVQFALEVGAL